MTKAGSGKKPPVRVRFYRLRNKLKEKAGGGSGEGGGTISADALAAAQEAFDQAAEDYPDWVKPYIDELYEHFRRCVDTPEQRLQHFAQVRRIAHDLKGQGSTFGYNLMTFFAASLYDFAFQEGEISDNHVELLKAHIDSMNVVIKDRIRGDGGEEGQALQKGLQDAIEKYMNTVE